MKIINIMLNVACLIFLANMFWEQGLPQNNVEFSLVTLMIVTCLFNIFLRYQPQKDSLLSLFIQRKKAEQIAKINELEQLEK